VSDRIKGCWVAFDHDIKDEDAEPIMDAIRRLRSVDAVEARVADMDDWMARKNVKAEIRAAVVELFKSL